MKKIREIVERAWDRHLDWVVAYEKTPGGQKLKNFLRHPNQLILNILIIYWCGLFSRNDFLAILLLPVIALSMACLMAHFYISREDVRDRCMEVNQEVVHNLLVKISNGDLVVPKNLSLNIPEDLVEGADFIVDDNGARIAAFPPDSPDLPGRGQHFPDEGSRFGKV